MIKFESLFKNILYNLQFLYRDINAANNILKHGLESFGLGISLEDYKLKAFQIS